MLTSSFDFELDVKDPYIYLCCMSMRDGVGNSRFHLSGEIPRVKKELSMKKFGSKLYS